MFAGRYGTKIAKIMWPHSVATQELPGKIRVLLLGLLPLLISRPVPQTPKSDKT